MFIVQATAVSDEDKKSFMKFPAEGDERKHPGLRDVQLPQEEGAVRLHLRPGDPQGPRRQGGASPVPEGPPGFNFTNILRAAFSYESFLRSFSVLTIWVYNFLVKGFWCKSCS
jgi:hypothetical protein